MERQIILIITTKDLPVKRLGSFWVDCEVEEEYPRKQKIERNVVQSRSYGWVFIVEVACRCLSTNALKGGRSSLTRSHTRVRCAASQIQKWRNWFNMGLSRDGFLRCFLIWWVMDQLTLVVCPSFEITEYTALFRRLYINVTKMSFPSSYIRW
jgi:hypothetical protein